MQSDFYSRHYIGDTGDAITSLIENIEKSQRRIKSMKKAAPNIWIDMELAEDNGLLQKALGRTHPMPNPFLKFRCGIKTVTTASLGCILNYFSPHRWIEKIAKTSFVPLKEAKNIYKMHMDMLKEYILSSAVTKESALRFFFEIANAYRKMQNGEEIYIAPKSIMRLDERSFVQFITECCQFSSYKVHNEKFLENHNSRLRKFQCDCTCVRRQCCYNQLMKLYEKNVLYEGTMPTMEPIIIKSPHSKQESAPNTAK